MTADKLADICKRHAAGRGISKYRIQRDTKLAPATVDRFFNGHGAARLRTALAILHKIGLDLQVIEAQD